MTGGTFVNAMKVYLLGSLCCGLSNSLGQLVAARVLQGIGGAMMTPVARLIVVASTPRERLAQAMNALILGSLLAVGFFRAAHYVASTAIAFAEVRPEEVSRASTLSTVIQQISLSFGISFAGLTLYASAGRSSHFTAAQFILPFVSLGLLTALAVPVYTRLAAQAGAHMRNAGKVSP